jgi:acyl carrier protein
MNLNEIEESRRTQRDEVTVQLRAELCRIQPLLPRTWPDGSLFQADLGLDSLDLVELVARVEQRYGMLIADTDLPSFVSLEAMTEYICAWKQR